MRSFFSAIRSHLALVIVFFALLFRLPLLNGSFWLDEAAQALESQRPFFQQLQIVDDFQPPLLHYVVHFSMYVGTAEWWLRTVGALIPGLVTVWFTYKIGEALWDKRTGLFAALLLSTSTFHIFYSQELRQYSLPAAFATVSWFVLIKSWRSNQTASLAQLSTFTIFTILGLYSSYLFPFVVIAQVVFVWSFLRKHLMNWLVVLTLAGLSFAPILPLFFAQLNAGSTLRIELPGWEDVVSFPQIKVLPLVMAKFIFGVSNVEISFPFIAVSVVIAGCLALIYKQQATKLFSPQMRVVFIWLAIPIFSAFLISYVVPVLQPKRVLYCLPGFYLLVAGTTTNLKKLRITQPAVLLISLLLLINVVGIYHYWSDPRLQREQWRELIQEIETKYPTQSAALFAFPEPFAPWIWYANPSYPTFTTGSVLANSNQQLTEDLKKINEYNHVLVFEYLTDLTDPDNLLHSNLKSFGYEEQGYFMYPNIGRVWMYSKPAAVISYIHE